MDTQPVKVVRRKLVLNIEERKHECFIVSNKNVDCNRSNEKLN